MCIGIQLFIVYNFFFFFLLFRLSPNYFGLIISKKNFKITYLFKYDYLFTYLQCTREGRSQNGTTANYRNFLEWYGTVEWWLFCVYVFLSINLIWFYLNSQNASNEMHVIFSVMNAITITVMIKCLFFLYYRFWLFWVLGFYLITLSFG
jgi:hypothetical protein